VLELVVLEGSYFYETGWTDLEIENRIDLN
jgi:hypothetical protein